MEENQPPEHQHRRLTAGEVRNKYGTTGILVLVWEIWCVRDGWFHPDPHYEYIGFSRFMAYLSFPVLLFCAIMAGSAIRAIRRTRQSSHSL